MKHLHAAHSEPVNDVEPDLYRMADCPGPVQPLMQQSIKTTASHELHHDSKGLLVLKVGVAIVPSIGDPMRSVRGEIQEQSTNNHSAFEYCVPELGTY